MAICILIYTTKTARVLRSKRRITVGQFLDPPYFLEKDVENMKKLILALTIKKRPDLAKKVNKIIAGQCKALGSWYKTLNIRTPYGALPNVDIFMNPSTKDLRDIVKSTGADVRLLATEDKKLYVWRGDVLHQYLFRVAPELKSADSKSKAIRFEGIIKGGKLFLTNSSHLKSAVRKQDWIEQYADIPYIEEAAYLKTVPISTGGRKTNVDIFVNPSS